QTTADKNPSAVYRSGHPRPDPYSGGTVPECILVVDDDNDILTAARLLLKRHFDAVTTSNQPDPIPALMAEKQFAVVLLDMNFVTGAQSGREGLTWMSRILQAEPEAVVV